MIHKRRTLEVSERVFNYLDSRLNNELGREDMAKIDCYLGTFNNCREQGYVLTVDDMEYNEGYKDPIHFWACECRNSDAVMIVDGTCEDYDLNGVFSEEAYLKHKKYFKCCKESEAADYIFDKIIKYFGIKL